VNVAGCFRATLCQWVTAVDHGFLPSGTGFGTAVGTEFGTDAGRLAGD